MLESPVFLRTLSHYLYLLGYECSGCFLMGIQGWSGLVPTVELYQRDLHSWLEAHICSVIFSSFNMIQLIRLSGLKYSLSSGRRENISYSPVPCTCLGAEKEVDSNGRKGGGLCPYWSKQFCRRHSRAVCGPLHESGNLVQCPDGTSRSRSSLPSFSLASDSLGCC